MSNFLKLVIVLALSSVKFSLALPFSFLIGLNFTQTFIITSIGGIAGVVAYFFLSRKLITYYNSHLKSYFRRAALRLFIYLKISYIFKRYFVGRRQKFTTTNRRIVKLKRKWGYYGVTLLAPLLLSIPVATFLVARFYKSRKNALVYLSLSILFWSLLVSASVSLIR